jgi:starch-binding outer membrane protein, SusD/RagB family
MNMKLRHKLWAPAMLTLAFMLPSCDLTIKESDSILIEDEGSVFDGVDDVAGSIDEIYNRMRGQTENQGGLYALTEVTTDELLVPTRGTDWGDNGVWRTLHTHTWSATHPDIVGVWNDKNGNILRATEVIHEFSNANATQLAEAKFLRAYNMWIVMDFWGQVPFREPTQGVTEIPAVMTRTEAYDMVVADLEAAIVGLPASNPTATNKTRAVRATARFLLAKVKLNANIYKGAYGAGDLQDVIDEVNAIEADGYAINPAGTYFNNFAGPDYPETDIIWSASSGAGNRMWNGLHYNQWHPDNSGGGWNGFTTHAEFFDKFEDNGAGDVNVIGGPQEERRGYVRTLATTAAPNYGFGYGFQIGQMYGFKDGAPTALQDRVGNPLVFTKTLPGLIGNNELTGIRVLKYSPQNGAFTSGVVMARFSDAHLMRAEAMHRLGQSAAALTEINELRSMRNNTPALAGPVTDAMILDERARELYTEGWRRNDMIRFDVFKNSWTFKDGEATADGHTNLFPIPSSALLSNPGLVQNPGY